jgi:catechol 2,3-dioxygenase-like lactoylglutathione lyase family enzyme
MRTEIDHVAIRTAEYDKARAFFDGVTMYAQ